MARPLRLVRVAALAVLALAVGACFKVDASAVVGGDGSAATRLVIELDIGAFEDLFGGLAESFGEEFGDEGVEQPSMTEELEASMEGIDDELAELYEKYPQLEDRFQVSASLEDDVFRTEMAALTDDVEDIGIFIDGVLGSGDGDFGEIFDIDEPLLDETGDEVGGGTGVFSSVTTAFEDGEFVFSAETPNSGGSFDDDIEFDFGGFPGLTPEIVLSITAPGDIIETNGETDGRTVTWELDGTESEGLLLRSEVDEGTSVDSLDAVGDVGGGDDDGGFPIVLVLVVLAVVGGGLFLFLRSRGGGGGSDDAAGLSDAEVRDAVDQPAPTVPPGPPAPPGDSGPSGPPTAPPPPPPPPVD